ncbi:MAG TPA: response regulator [Verrucomicrobiae bacterium]|nr:response regulator [Verrucomicrobiae bacterium]
MDTLRQLRLRQYARSLNVARMESDPVTLEPLQPLRDLNVLVVEDDYLQASASAMALEESGANVLGPVPDLEDARDVLEQIAPDCVLLDLRLRDQYAFLLADELRLRGIPIVLATGYDISVFPFTPQPEECLLKPFSDAQLVRAVQTAMEHHRAAPVT